MNVDQSQPTTSEENAMTTNTQDEAAHAIALMHGTMIEAARQARDTIQDAVGRAFDEALEPFGDQPPSEACPQAVSDYEQGMERAKRIYRVLATATDEMVGAAYLELRGMPGLTPNGTGHGVL